MIDLRYVRQHGNRPRVHGNGFIQLDLTDRSRLHIWGDHRIPKQKVATPIHDHVFGFMSRCLVGRLINIRYDISHNPDGPYTHIIYEPKIRQGEDTVLHSTEVLVSPYVTGGELVTRNFAGDPNRVYYMHSRHFHETVATEPSATLITKEGLTQAQGSTLKPRVLVPVMQEPDNEFNRYQADEDLLWRIIEDTLKRRK